MKGIAPGSVQSQVCHFLYQEADSEKFVIPWYYKRVFEEFFVSTDANVENKSSVTNRISECHRFGWLLFVHAFSRFKDLVTCTNGLISIMVS
ncbi:putative retinoblastoma-associated protein [Medicago truncatula]|uniref:Putative retinoblastoma-associated protein n=1 Tax=Medicago truncatula TaxID=3880 RepID=A0A396IN26_MEDTR|nr:putative retinoblastoma-associated protein [Medicago truncatula]